METAQDYIDKENLKIAEMMLEAARRIWDFESGARGIGIELLEIDTNLFDRALDLLGVPKENTPDYDDLARGKVEWTDEHFCRDWISEKFDEFQNIKDYIVFVRKKVHEGFKGDYTADHS